jgi:chitodextrinase
MRPRLLFALLVCAAILPVRAYYDVTVTGTYSGSVWGSGPYTDDSAIGKAAVHAGLISIGQVATIRVESLGTQSNFVGTTQNGIQTYSWASSWGAISLSLAPGGGGGGGSAPTVELTAPTSVALCSTITLSATAADADSDLVSLAIDWQYSGQIGWWTASGSSASRSVVLTNATTSPGTLYFRAEATDAAGRITQGPWVPVTVTAASNQAPSASLTAPVSAYASNSFGVIASASDPEGLLAQLAVVSQSTGTVQSWSVSGSSATQSAYPVAPSSAGTIYLRTEASDTAGATGASAWWGVAVTGPPPALSVSPTSVAANGSVSVTYSGAYPDAWIGLFAVGGSSYSPLASGSIPGGGSGTLSLALSPASFFPGQSYEARYFPSGSYSPSAWSNTFTVTGASTYTLTVEYGSGSASGLVSGSTCWIHAGSPGPGESFWRWVLTGGSGTIQSLTATSTLFTMHASDASVRACFTSVAVFPNPAEAGGSVSVAYSGALTTANRVTLAHAGAPDSSYLSHAYVPSAGSGSVSFSLASGYMTGVSYEARLMLDGSTVMARSAPFTLAASANHSVTVLGGSGGGTGLTNGSSVEIRADIPPLGQKFSHWSIVSGAGALANPSSPLTQVTLTSGSLSVQAYTTAAPSSDEQITGSTSGGAVWGTDIYTTDSDKARAAVHAGLLAPGQAGVIRVHQIGNWYGFNGSLRNEVSSLSYGPYTGMRLERLAVAPTYTLTVTGGTGGGSNLAEGTVRTLVATVPSGLTFQSWSHVSGPGALSSAAANPTSFTVGAGHATVQAVFRDNQPPPTPTWNEPNNLGPTHVNLLWMQVFDASDVTGYELFLDGVSLGVSATPSRWVTGLQPLTTYVFKVRAQDGAGNLSPLSTPRSVTTLADTTPPVTPINFSASSLTPVSVVLSWAAMYDNVGVTAYVVYQNGVALTDPPQPLLAQTARTITGLLPETAYTFHVRARDGALNLSGPSTGLQVTTPADTTPPSVPGFPTSTAVTRTSLSLTWPPSSDTVGVAAYELRVNGAVHPDRPSTNSSTLSGLAPGTTYAIELRARDAKGNWSDWSFARSFTTLPPTPIVTSALTTTGAYASPFSYTITASHSPTSFSATGLPAGLTLNSSAGVISGLLPTPGTYPITLRGHNANGTGDPAVLSLTVAKAAPIGIGRTVYNQPGLVLTAADLLAIFRHPDNPNAAAPSGTVTAKASFTPLFASTPVTFDPFTPTSIPSGITAIHGKVTITATFNGDANYGSVERVVEFQNFDTQPPSVPTSLVFDVASPSAAGVRWSPSMDGPPGIQRPRLTYEVTTGTGAAPPVIATVDRPAVWLQGLNASTLYNVRVRAKDAFGNLSAWSAAVAATTAEPGSTVASSTPTEGGAPRDIDGDGILDTVYAAGTSSFSYQAGETTTAQVSWYEYELSWGYDVLFGLDLFYYQWTLSSLDYHLGITVDFFRVEVCSTYKQVFPHYSILAEPLAVYAVYALAAGQMTTEVLTPRVLEPDPAGETKIHHVDDGRWWEYNHFHSTPQVLVKLGENVSKVKPAGTTGEPVSVGPDAGSGGTVVETQQSGVEKIIEVLDQFGRAISSSVRWQIRNGSVTVSTGVGPVRVGISTAGTFQVGIQIQDGQYRWFNVVVLPATAQISLAVDANRDGQIRLPHEDSSDATSATAPYRFWLNNDDDRAYSSSEWSESDPERYPPQEADSFGQLINSARDCEDLTRIWIDAQGVINAVRASSDLYLGFKWRNTNGTEPSIRLFRSADPDGGLGHVRNAEIGRLQGTGAPNSITMLRACLGDAGADTMPNPPGGHPWVSGITQVRPDSRPADFILRKDALTEIFGARATGYLLFEGVQEGKGELMLVLVRKRPDGAWEKVAEGGSVWLQLDDVRRMYIRVHSTPLPEGFPHPWQAITPVQAPYEEDIAHEKALTIPELTLSYATGDSVEAPSQYPFVASPAEQSKCVIFVHGIDMNVPEMLGYANSFFKRLWWAGYRGRFVSFRWSTPLSSDGLFGWEETDENTSIFNSGEYRSWKAGASLRKFTEALRSPASPFFFGTNATIGILAHSLGNACVGEALRQGMTVNSYVALKAAVPLSCYYPTGVSAPVRQILVDADALDPTPQYAGFYNGYHGYLSSLGGANRVSYYGASDFWLETGRTRFGLADVSWMNNQVRRKPDDPWNHWSNGEVIEYLWDTNQLKAYFRRGAFYRRVLDPHESMAFVSRPRTAALGAVSPPAGFGGLDLESSGTYSFTASRADHSGLFQRDIQLMYGDPAGLAWMEPLFLRLLRDLQVSP